jgi:hypothetical protein
MDISSMKEWIKLGLRYSMEMMKKKAGKENTDMKRRKEKSLT